MAEYFDVLDDKGIKTGETKLRTEVHRDGDWHKEVYVWIVNDKNEILLQKRSPAKIDNPNMWDISVGGHVVAGNGSLDTAIQEIKEELDIDISESEIQFVGTLKSARKHTETFINNSFGDIYLYRLPRDINNLKLQEDEVSEVKYFSIPELKDMIARKDPTFLMHLAGYCEMLFDALNQT